MIKIIASMFVLLLAASSVMANKNVLFAGAETAEAKPLANSLNAVVVDGVLLSTFAGVDPGVNYSIASQLFSGFYIDSPDDTTELSIVAADDFEVPMDEIWRIKTVRNMGTYFNGPGPADSVNVYILGDAGGLPNALNVSDQSIYAYEGIPFVDESTADLRIDLVDGANQPLPAVLPAGRYWLVIQPVMSPFAGGQYGWTESALTPNSGTTLGFESAWMQNAAFIPGTDGSTHCVGAWGPRLAECKITRNPDTSPPLDGDLVFELIGDSGPVLNIDTLESFATIASGLADSDTLDGHTLLLAATTFNEQVVINKRVNLFGAGSGPGGSVINGRLRINASGESQANPLQIRSLRVTGAAEGFRIDNAHQFIKLNSVAAVGNDSYGLHFNLSNEGPVSGIEILDSLFEENLGGLRTSSDAEVTNVHISNTDFINNTQYALLLGGGASSGEAKSNNWRIEGGLVANNGDNGGDWGGGFWIWTSGPASEVRGFTITQVEFRGNGGNPSFSAGIKIFASKETLIQNLVISESIFIGDGLNPPDQLIGVQVTFLNEQKACGAIRILDNTF